VGRRKTWTIENEAYLSENYGIIPILDIAEKLETTELAVEAHWTDVNKVDTKIDTI